jgi:tetratricopeptide (TPR) repeat protein
VRENEKVMHLLTLVLVNSILGLCLTRDDFDLICNDIDIEAVIRNNEQSLNELLTLNRRGFININSSIVAQALICETGIFNQDTTMNILSNLCKRLNNLYISGSRYEDMLKTLGRAGSMSFIFSYEVKDSKLLPYFEKIKEIPYNKNNLHFWLQYAIACCNTKEYERADLYFKNARSYAVKLYKFEPYQIDTHYARFLLERQIERADGNPYKIFCEAHELLTKHYTSDLNKRNFTFHVSEIYYDYYKHFFTSFDTEEQKSFLRKCEEMLTRVRKYRAYVRYNPDTSEPRFAEKCENKLNNIFLDEMNQLTTV